MKSYYRNPTEDEKRLWEQAYDGHLKRWWRDVAGAFDAASEAVRLSRRSKRSRAKEETTSG